MWGREERESEIWTGSQGWDLLGRLWSGLLGSQETKGWESGLLALREEGAGIQNPKS